jgi:hypothetical protein
MPDGRSLWYTRCRLAVFTIPSSAYVLLPQEAAERWETEQEDDGATQYRPPDTPGDA